MRAAPRYAASHVLANVAPAVLARLLDDPPPAPAPEGSQLKLNMLLSRLPRLRDPAVDPADAFAGTFHVNEGYEQLQRAFEQASRGEIPRVPPCELYCHSLTDPSILSDELRQAGAHALTLFALHMPARLFAGDKAAAAAAKRDAVQATLRSVDSVLAEPLQDCLWRDGAGNLCLEALTPPELERELAMPGGHIFHRDLSWPFAGDARGGRDLGRRNRSRQRLAVRRRRAARRRSQRHPWAQRGSRGARRAALAFAKFCRPDDV